MRIFQKFEFNFLRCTRCPLLILVKRYFFLIVVLENILVYPFSVMEKSCEGSQEKADLCIPLVCLYLLHREKEKLLRPI